MRDADLPLFNWHPPVKVLVFPLINRVGKVRKTAAILSRKHGEDAILYWKQVTAANRKHLVRIGLDDIAVDAQLRSFHDAVQSEMIRQHYTGSNNPKGAA
ncbi:MULTISPECIES: DUF6074 family protein [Bacteria]|nr:DUF6074 family protein [Agrobacterium pusense]